MYKITKFVITTFCLSISISALLIFSSHDRFFLLLMYINQETLKYIESEISLNTAAREEPKFGSTL